MVAFATDYVFNQSGVAVSWTVNDAIVLFPDGEGYVRFWAKTPNGNISDFDAYGFGVAPNSYFVAVYPRDSRSGNTLETALPMTYTGQKQTANDNTSHLSAYDYMKSPRTLSTETALNFTFSHLGSVIRFEVTMPSEQILTSLTLNTPTPLTLILDNIKVRKDDNLVAYMMVPPTTLTNGTATLTLTNNSGEVAEVELTGTEIVAGKCYPVEIKCPAFVTVTRSKGTMLHSETVATDSPAHSAMATAAGEPILYPTAYAPDLTIDAAHPIRQADMLLPGDVNEDGEVMLDDAVLLVNHYLNRTTSQLNASVADVNNDGDIDLADAVAIVNIYLRR